MQALPPTTPTHAQHSDTLTQMYAAAPINGLINKHIIRFDDKGYTRIEGFVVETKHLHTAGLLHSTCYFKLLDYAAFFAALARARILFVMTSALTLFS